MKSLLCYRPSNAGKAWLFFTSISLAIAFYSCTKDTEKIAENRIQPTLELSLNGPVVKVHAGQSIQAAVNAAVEGTVIQIEPGTYNEAITVSKARLQLIGINTSPMAKVIIQNPGGSNNGISVSDSADGFVLKNLTIQNFKKNGVFMRHVDDFIISSVETINNGAYGLFPLFCKRGLIDHCTSTGHTDTGIYIGQSEEIVLRQNTAFANVNGLEVENCKNVLVSRNDAHDNVCGILVVLLPGLSGKKSSDITVIDNHVDANNHVNFAEPGEGFEGFIPSGSGVLVVGVDHASITRNKITNNTFVGIAVVSSLNLGAIAGLPPEAFADIEPNPDGAKINGNISRNNGTVAPPGIPLPPADLLWDGSGTNNCWLRNNFGTNYPSPLPTCR